MDYELGNKDNPLPADQLSMEWNEMERKFEDDKFWYFISDDNAGCQTRIDLLFDFVTHKDNSKDKDYSYLQKESQRNNIIFREVLLQLGKGHKKPF